MDIVTLGAALNGSAEYVNSHFKGGSNIQIVDNPDGTQTINASGKVSSEDTVARADIAAIKDGETLDSFGDVETALATKANTATTYTKTEVDTALDNKVDKVSGKGLSTNDYTTAEKTKLAGIAEGAEANEIEGIKVNSSTVNPDANKVVNITVPTTAADVSALPDTTKYAAALSLTINSSTFVMTGQLKDQNGDNLGTAQTIDLPLESVVVGGSYNSQTKKVVLTLQNGNTIEFSIADLVSGLQTELSASNKLNPAYINYDSAHRAVSDAEKATWNGKQDALTFDNTPTNGSSNPVTSGGIYTALGNKVDKETGKDLSTNDFTDADKAQISANKAGIGAVANRGSKNMLPIKNHAVGDATETNGFRFTVQADGGILIESIGTHSGNGDYYLIGRWGNRDTLIDCSDGTYTATLEANDDMVSKVAMRIYKAGNSYIVNNVYANTSADFTGEIAFIFITAYTDAVIPSGGVVIYPMIRPASIENSTFQPYAMSNAELTAKAAIEDISDKIIATSGYTVNSLTKLYKQNNRIFGQVIISKDTGSFSIAEETIAEFSSGYCPKDIQIQSCFFGASIYNIENIGYTYIQRATAVSGAGSVIVKAYQSVGTVVNIHVDFVI